jgi:hypothetical protein
VREPIGFSQAVTDEKTKGDFNRTNYVKYTYTQFLIKII